VTGQHSAVLLLGIAGGLWALRENRELAAGAYFGLLGLKPNWAVFFVAWLLLTRRWRVFGAMAGVGILMILSTAPMGWDAWTAYLAAGPRAVADLLDPAVGRFDYPAHKLITIEA